MSRVAVVIPTKDRTETLARTLARLEGQSLDGDFEVIVVDNGSSAGELERARELVGAASMPVRLVEHPRGGPAAARNAGVEAASADIILLLGDDTEPADAGLVQAHLDLHAARPEESYGVLGRITWSPRTPVTPLMRWLENGGPQFAYGDISPGPVDAARYLYSSHASLKRGIFERVGGFEPHFPDAAIEDIDLGVRLAEAGFELDYHPELLVLHDHPTSLEQSLTRQIRVGRSAALYNELRGERPRSAIAPPAGVKWTAARILRPLIDLAARMPLPRAVQTQLWLAMHRERYAQGYRLGPPAAR
jgi:glycosyltransferase involved in cell wall biosynthesis